MADFFSEPETPDPQWADPSASPFDAAHPRGTMALALLLGTGAALLGAALWAMIVAYTGYQIGFAAIGVAVLVAAAVRVGARGATGTGLRVASVVLTLVAMTAAEYLTVRHFVNEVLAAEGSAERVPLLISPVDTVLVVGESLMLDPATLVFWAIALYTAWRYSAPREPEPLFP